MRGAATEKFTEFINELADTPRRIAVIGGTSQDPEVKVLIQQIPIIEIHFFNIENVNSDKNYHQLDINSYNSVSEFVGYFDLVMSCHVIEHVWNHARFFELFEIFSRPKGAIWVNCPTSNIVHGSPEYFAAGFTANYLNFNLQARGFRSVLQGELGNKRFYIGAHVFRIWLSGAENRHPLLNYEFQSGTPFGVVRKFLKDVPSRIILEFLSNQEQNFLCYQTETYFGAVKDR